VVSHYSDWNLQWLFFVGLFWVYMCVTWLESPMWLFFVGLFWVYMCVTWLESPMWLFFVGLFWVYMCVTWQWSAHSRKSVRGGLYAQEVNWIRREVNSTISTGTFYLKCRSKYKGSSDKKIYIHWHFNFFTLV